MKKAILALGLVMCVGYVHAQTPPARFWHSMSSNGATTSAASRIYMHGGADFEGSTHLNDLWYYHADSGLWTQVTHIGRVWPKLGRANGALSCGAGRCVLFAGSLGTKYVNETWHFAEPAGTATGATWTQVSCRKVNSCPSARYLPLMAFDPVRGYHVSFGGRSNSDVALRDTWTFNGSSWTPRAPVSSPAARGGGSAAFVPTHVSNGTTVTMNKVVIFGGNPYPNAPYPEALCDMHAWNGSTWQAITATNQGPCLAEATMAWAAGASVNPHLIVTGGFGAELEGMPSYETWYFTFDSGTSGTWTRATSSSCSPHAYARGAYDAPSSLLVFFGGSEGLNAYDDTHLCQ